jgi:hypothetical protein
VEPDYLPDSDVYFSRAWTPFPNGGCGGDFPPQLSPGGAAPPERNIGKNFLVKYCNFVVKLDRSL